MTVKLKPNSYSVLLCCGLACFWIAFLSGCKRNAPQPTPKLATPLEVLKLQFPESELEQGESLPFEVHWPPIDPQRKPAKPRPALLSGELLVLPGRSDAGLDARIQIQLTRPTSEESRLRWNKQLKFPEYLWMARLRVRDKDQKWLWPNVGCLLTAYGVERKERYGGVDPKRNVDNDFAAVVVRSYDDQGNELDETIDQPLLTARWEPGSGDPSIQNPTIRSIVHSAKSDVLQILLADSALQTQNESQNNSTTASGEIRVWLIYADFMHAQPPASWPKKKEFSGGILNYFSIDWKQIDNKIEIQSATWKVPPEDTRVDWQSWSESGKPLRLKSDTN